MFAYIVFTFYNQVSKFELCYARNKSLFTLFKGLYLLGKPLRSFIVFVKACVVKVVLNLVVVD